MQFHHPIAQFVINEEVEVEKFEIRSSCCVELRSKQQNHVRVACFAAKGGIWRLRYYGWTATVKYSTVSTEGIIRTG